MSLSVCFLTRNEESKIARALLSVALVADEIIVGDTGSTDGTVAAAAELGARVVPVKWQDDFAAAQNQVVAQAKGDWLFWLNPDEELLASSWPAVHACLAKPEALGYYVVKQEQAKADRPEQVTEILELRLYRRHPELRYAGRTQPQFEIPLEEVARREGKEVLRSAITIRRHAYLSQLTDDKLRWAARLLEKELRDRPGQLHYLIEYGRTLLLLRDPKGHQVLAEAAEQLLPFLEAPAAPVTTVQRLLEYVINVAPHLLQGRLGRDQARELAQRWFPHSPPLVWSNAQAEFQRGNFGGAAVLLKGLVEMGKTGSYDKSSGFDPSIIGESAVLNLGLCYRQLGDLDAAEGCFRQVLGSKNLQSVATAQLAELHAQRAAVAGSAPVDTATGDRDQNPGI